MAILPVSRLIQPVARDDVLADLIQIGDSLKLRASSWRGPARWLLIALAEIGSRATVQIAAIAAHSYNDTAWGYGLTLLSRSQFDNDRAGATRAKGILTASDTGSVGPVTWPAGTRTFSPVGALADFTWTNTGEVTIGLDASDVEFEVEAVSPGSGHNDVPNDADWQTNPTQSGITIGNPANATSPAGNWLTALGADEQTDSSLREANRDKWSTLGGNAPKGAYEYWATTATDAAGDPVGITRALVPEPPGDGTLTIYVATATGAPTASQVTDVQTYIDARHSITADPTVTAASEVSVDVTAELRLQAGSSVTATEAQEALQDAINAAPIGGIPDGDGATIPRTALIDVLHDLDDSVIKVVMSTPASDVAVGDDEVAVPGTLTITVTEV